MLYILSCKILTSVKGYFFNKDYYYYYYYYVTRGVKVVCNLWVQCTWRFRCVLWGDINGGVKEVDTFGRVCYFKFDGGVK